LYLVTGIAFNSLNSGNESSTYAVIHLLDEDGNLLATEEQFISQGANIYHFISTEIEVVNKEAKFAVVYVANESPTDVYFDDLSLKHERLVWQENNYYPFGLAIAPLDKKGEPDHRFTYNGKELEEETGYLDYHARQMDGQLGRFMSVDPLAEKSLDKTTYHFVSNNPINRLDPTGKTDFALNKKTGEITQVGEVNDEPDRILRTNGKGEVKRNKKTGEVKVDIKDISKGILQDGMNFKEDDNVIDVGNEGQATVEGVEDFLTKFSNYIGKEMSGAYLSTENGDDANISKIYIDEYDGNTVDESTTSLRGFYQGGYLENYNTITHFHTHPSSRSRSRTAIENPSGPDKKHKKDNVEYYNNFLILTRSANYPYKAQKIKY